MYPENIAPELQATIGVCIPVVLLFVGLRLYRRVVMTRDIGLDDYLCLATTVAFLTYLGLTLSLFESLGPRTWQIPDAGIDNSFAQRSTAATIIYFLLAICVKLMFCALYLRLFDVKRCARAAIYSGSAVILLFYVAAAAVQLGLCTPQRALFAGSSSSSGGGDGGGNVPNRQFDGHAAGAEARRAPSMVVVPRRCATTAQHRFVVLVAFSAVSNWFLFLLPLPIVWRLRLDMRRKVALTLLFMTGLLACIISILRIVFRDIGMYGDKATDWKAIRFHCLGVAEPTLCIICGCLPVVWSMLQHVLQRCTRFVRFHVLARASLSKHRRGDGGSTTLAAVAGAKNAKPPPTPPANEPSSRVQKTTPTVTTTINIITTPTTDVNTDTAAPTVRDTCNTQPRWWCIAIPWRQRQQRKLRNGVLATAASSAAKAAVSARSRGNDKGGAGLPSIPHATLTGLRSLWGDGSRSVFGTGIDANGSDAITYTGAGSNGGSNCNNNNNNNSSSNNNRRSGTSDAATSWGPDSSTLDSVELRDTQAQRDLLAVRHGYDRGHGHWSAAQPAGFNERSGSGSSTVRVASASTPTPSYSGTDVDVESQAPSRS